MFEPRGQAPRVSMQRSWGLLLHAAAIGIASGSSLTSGVCKELEQGTTASLELLQHGQHGLERAGKHDKLEASREAALMEGETEGEAALRLVREEAVAKLAAKPKVEQHATDTNEETEDKAGKPGAKKAKQEAERKATDKAVTGQKVSEKLARELSEEAEQNATSRKTLHAEKAKQAAERKATDKAVTGEKVIEKLARELSEEAEQNATRRKTLHAEKATQANGRKATDTEETEATAATGKGKHREKAAPAQKAKQEAEQDVEEAEPQAKEKKKLVTQEFHNSVNLLIDDVTSSLRAMNHYTREFEEMCATYRADITKNAKRSTDEGFEVAADVLPSIVLQKVPPITEHFARIITALQDQGNQGFSALEALGVSDAFVESQAKYFSVLSTAADLSKVLDKGVSHMKGLADATKEGKKTGLGKVESESPMAIEQVSNFKQKFIDAFELLIKGFNHIDGTSLSQTSSASSLKSVRHLSKSMAQKLANALTTLIDGTQEASNLVLKSESKQVITESEPVIREFKFTPAVTESKPVIELESARSAAAGLGVQLGLSLAVACIGAV